MKNCIASETAAACPQGVKRPLEYLFSPCGRWRWQRSHLTEVDDQDRREAVGHARHFIEDMCPCVR